MTAAALTPVDIGHARYVALIDPGTAFWALVDKTRVTDTLAGGPLLDAYREKAVDFSRELHALRFDLKPSAVYVNPTERCNLDCTYCYLPGKMRRDGSHMPEDKLLAALDKLRRYFATVMPEGRRPRIIFHGSEPLLNRHAVFAAIDAFGDDFVFGLSLDGPEAAITDSTRRTWSVITTCTTENLTHLTRMVELFHAREVPTCMFNTVRCTLPGARGVKPADPDMARAFHRRARPQPRAVPGNRAQAGSG